MTDKKIFIINGSPRKNWNTDKMCQSFADGAKSKGVSVETIYLYDLNFKGCRSCFACKLKGGKNFSRCAYPDDLTPILDKISKCDGLILASPIYFGNVTAEMRAFVERLLFPFFQYDKNFSSTAPKRMETAIIYTMNISEQFLKENPLGQRTKNAMESIETFVELVLKKPQIIYAFDTYQFNDYEKYASSAFDPVHKAKQRDEQFPKYLQKAYDEGVNMAKRILCRGIMQDSL